MNHQLARLLDLKQKKQKVRNVHQKLNKEQKQLAHHRKLPDTQVETLTSEGGASLRLGTPGKRPDMAVHFTTTLQTSLAHPTLSWSRVRAHYLNPSKRFIMSYDESPLVLVLKGERTCQFFLNITCQGLSSITHFHELGLRCQELDLDFHLRQLHYLDIRRPELKRRELLWLK